MTGKLLRRGSRLLGLTLMLALGGCSNFELLNPQGDIGVQERTLILLALGVMLLVVIPVIVLTLVFAWRYRASNTKATYAPNWAHSTAIEIVIWSVPCVIVVSLAVLIWGSTHSLDPYKPLQSDAAPVQVEVVALNWKWLFIYPEYGVASVNRLVIPANTPIEFKLTAESLMNSFFIPQLGTQIYAMPGMQTQLHLIANNPGTYDGLSSAFSGPGFSDMHFAAVATSPAEFKAWVETTKSTARSLDMAAYRSLEQPSIKNPAAVYGNVAPGLFDRVVDQFMSAPSVNTALNGSAAICTADGQMPRSEN